MFTANREFEVRLVPHGDSGCHSVPEQGTAGRQDWEPGNREGKGEQGRRRVTEKGKGNAGRRVHADGAAVESALSSPSPRCRCS